MNAFYQVLRWFFVALLFSTAIGKLLDIQGFAAVLHTYQLFIPYIVLAPLGLGISLFELVLGTALIARVQLRLCALLLILMHSGYVILAVITNLRGLELDNCGCFGVFLARPMTWITVVEDIVLTVLSALLYWTVTRKAEK